ncbi:RWD domain-containing protein 3-like, partial [Ruditapes philippinarum]|uniref:RWD domain-containing protein 3-like n=1 Tax=Ruditapes philippinarum TaxID=129788 RepID=UPI00295BEA47
FIFSSENEVIINTDFETLKCEDTLHPVKIIFIIGKEYPNQLPQISVFSENLDREIISRVKRKVLQNCSELLGEPMLISLIMLIKENLQLEVESEMPLTGKSLCKVHKNMNNANSGSENIWTDILHIDHMRSKNKYCKTLEKWAAELTLCGKILFCNKLIIIILQGDIKNIKDFIVRLKTVSVDVDSKGHSCKERMMTVLCEHQHNISDIIRFKDFNRQELSCREEVETIFMEAGLITLYREHVMRLN